MKTLRIKMETISRIIRVSDKEAKRLVLTGKYEYCPKHLWKAQKEKSHATSSSNL